MKEIDKSSAQLSLAVWESSLPLSPRGSPSPPNRTSLGKTAPIFARADIFPPSSPLPAQLPSIAPHYSFFDRLQCRKTRLSCFSVPPSFIVFALSHASEICYYWGMTAFQSIVPHSEGLLTLHQNRSTAISLPRPEPVFMVLAAKLCFLLLTGDVARWLP